MDEDVKVSSNTTRFDELRKGPWTVDEDFILIDYVNHHGEGRWNSLARCAGLKRTGKSCRLRWLNYLRPDLRRGNITLQEQLLILHLHSQWGNRWSKIAQHLPGRTDNEIKNYWRTRVQKHAKQLKCDVNSKQFNDAVRYLWMPRLLHRIHAAAVAAPPPQPSPSTRSSTAAAHSHTAQNYASPESTAHAPFTQLIISSGEAHGHTYTPDNSTMAASSDSFGTPASDFTDGYINMDYYNPNQFSYVGEQSGLTGPMGFCSQEMSFSEQSGLWMMDGEWTIDDVWPFMQQQQKQLDGH